MERVDLTPPDDCFSYTESGATEFSVSEWYKSVGDSVEKDENFCLINTQKTLIDLQSPASGTLAEIRCPADDDRFYPRGTVIGILEAP